MNIAEKIKRTVCKLDYYVTDTDMYLHIHTHLHILVEYLHVRHLLHMKMRVHIVQKNHRPKVLIIIRLS